MSHPAQTPTIDEVKQLIHTFGEGLEQFFVKRAEYNMLLQQVAHLEALLANKGAALQADLCQSGKYRGIARSQILETDPQYIVWLADNNTGQKIGFTEEETAQARAKIAAKGGTSVQGMQGRHYRPAEFKSPAEGGSGFDDYDDDIPF